MSISQSAIWRISSNYYRKIIASDFVRKVAETFATRILLIGIGLATSVIVARILGPEGRGLYAVAVAIGAIGVQFGNMGLHASNTYSAARKRSLVPTLVGNSLLVSFVFGGLVAALAWVVFSLWPNLAPVHGILLVLALVWIPVGLAYMLMRDLLLGVQEIRAYNKIDLISSLFGVILIILLIVINIVTVETVFSAGLIMVIISLVWVLRGLRPYFTRTPVPSLALFKDNIRYGLKVYLADFFAFLVLRVDILMAKYILGSKQTGYYSVAVSMADMVYVLPVIIGTIMFPKLSSMPSIVEKWKFTKTVAKCVAIVMVSLGGLAALIAGPVVRVLYGQAFVPAVPAFLWLMPGIFFLSLQTVIIKFAASENYPISITLFYFFVSVLNIILNYFFLNYYGIKGASLASSICYALLFLLVTTYTLRMLKNPCYYENSIN